MACDRSLDVAAYLDGELDASEALAVERHLENCAECRALKAQREELEAAFRAVSYYRTLRPLRRRIARQLDREAGPQKRANFWLGACSGAGAMALAAALTFFLLWPQGFLVNYLLEAHQRSLLPNHLIDVASSDRHTVKPWFAAMPTCRRPRSISPPRVIYWWAGAEELDEFARLMKKAGGGQ